MCLLIIAILLLTIGNMDNNLDHRPEAPSVDPLISNAAAGLCFGSFIFRSRRGARVFVFHDFDNEYKFNAISSHSWVNKNMQAARRN